jgi:hypothetical protein
MTNRENYIRTVRRTGPEWMPLSLHPSPALWDDLGDELDEVCARHPVLFPNHQKGTYKERKGRKAGTTERDPWGCLWEFDFDGIEGQVVESPLDDWAKLDTYEPPDPAKFTDRGEVDWDAFHTRSAEIEAEGGLTSGSLDHGFFLMRLWYLRGFDNFMMDVATGDERLHRLCEMITRRNRYRVEQFIAAGVDQIQFPDDLGTQTASIISPRSFREWGLPNYRAVMQPCREAGIIVGTHSDGYIIELVDILLEAGADILNPQDLCNGLENIERTMKGRCCINLDIDRQKIVPFGTPQEIKEHIDEATRRLGSPEGGLMMVVGIYPPTPPENCDALFTAFEKARTFFWE